MPEDNAGSDGLNEHAWGPNTPSQQSQDSGGDAALPERSPERGALLRAGFLALFLCSLGYLASVFDVFGLKEATQARSDTVLRSIFAAYYPMSLGDYLRGTPPESDYPLGDADDRETNLPAGWDRNGIGQDRLRLVVLDDNLLTLEDFRWPLGWRSYAGMVQNMQGVPNLIRHQPRSIFLDLVFLGDLGAPRDVARFLSITSRLNGLQGNLAAEPTCLQDFFRLYPEFLDGLGHERALHRQFKKLVCIVVPRELVNGAPLRTGERGAPIIVGVPRRLPRLARTGEVLPGALDLLRLFDRRVVFAPVEYRLDPGLYPIRAETDVYEALGHDFAGLDTALTPAALVSLIDKLVTCDRSRDLFSNRGPCSVDAFMRQVDWDRGATVRIHWGSDAPEAFQNSLTGAQCPQEDRPFSRAVRALAGGVVAGQTPGETAGRKGERICLYHPVISYATVKTFQQVLINGPPAEQAALLARDFSLLFKDRHIMVGSDFAASNDWHATPIHGEVIGAAVHAMAADNFTEYGWRYLRTDDVMIAGLPFRDWVGLFLFGLVVLLGSLAKDRLRLSTARPVLGALQSRVMPKRTDVLPSPGLVPDIVYAAVVGVRLILFLLLSVAVFVVLSVCLVGLTLLCALVLSWAMERPALDFVGIAIAGSAAVHYHIGHNVSATLTEKAQSYVSAYLPGGAFGARTPGRSRSAGDFSTPTKETFS